jgi:hypothetical protein
MFHPMEQGVMSLKLIVCESDISFRMNVSGISLYSCLCAYADRFSVAADISEGYKGNRKYDLLTEVKSNEDVEKGAAAVPEATAGSTPQPQPRDKPKELSKSCSGNYN